VKAVVSSAVQVLLPAMTQMENLLTLQALHPTLLNRRHLLQTLLRTILVPLVVLVVP